MISRRTADLAFLHQCDGGDSASNSVANRGSRRLSRATAERQVDDLAAELSDRFGPLPDEARRLLDFAKLRCRAIDLGIDSITRHPGMIMIGHHDRQRIDALRQAAAKKGSVVRVVDQKTAVVPLHADTLADRDVPSYFQSLEHLLRYCALPPFAPERLSVIRGPDGRATKVRYMLPRHKAANWVGPGRGRKSMRPGANGLVELSPFEFLDRLADLVPPPRKHRHRLPP